jgi:hypothetical protein
MKAHIRTDILPIRRGGTTSPTILDQGVQQHLIDAHSSAKSGASDHGLYVRRNKRKSSKRSFQTIGVERSPNFDPANSENCIVGNAASDIEFATTHANANWQFV